ncbi:hypothetical protein GCM10009733_093730 [Nonomuraea maheshkhaliensis]|uniref:WD40 repeat domain-containing protein n=1 Tax=Nonomuraea maheshkhaliensis TaxID=419590 RepID=A0ABN2H6H7_9ACTN
MRTKILSALTPVLALTTAIALVWPAPAQAHVSGHAHDSIRYASIKSCPIKGGGARPCGSWRLVMHSGAKSTLPDAQTLALEADGSANRYVPAPIAVSGNGRRVAYFTKKGRLAVRTLGGGVTLLAKDALPKRAQYEVTLALSDDGARLAASPRGDRPAGTRIFDTATGEQLGVLPPEATVAGFSGDGGELIATIQADESVTELAAYSETGEELSRVTPPQVIAANLPPALAADGRTAAILVGGAKAQTVMYDMAGDQVGERRRVKLPAGHVHMLDWTGDHELTAHLISEPGGKTRMTIVRIDTGNGSVKIRDRYTILPDSFVFAACGG